MSTSTGGETLTENFLSYVRNNKMHNFAVAVYYDDFEALLIRQTSTWYYIVYGHIHRILIRIHVGRSSCSQVTVMPPERASI